MDKFLIKGGTPLEGSVNISGAKNAVLPIITASLLTEGVSEIHNVPALRDVFTMNELMEILGAEVEFKDGVIRIDTSNINNFEAPYDLVRKMRASVYVLGPLLGRFGKAVVSLPGGCAWGPRPIDLHLYGMEKLGAEIELEAGYIRSEAKKLKGAKIDFEKSSVGASGNVLMAAVLAEGDTVINNFAIEPEINFLAETLVKMGAKIEGIGTRSLKITGVSKLNPVKTEVIPDRIETGTFMTACAIAGGRITIKKSKAQLVDAVTNKLREAGILVETGDDIIVESSGSFNPVDIVTNIFPGFPTDMQAQWIALMSVAKGNCVVEDTIYHDRFTHVAELNRFGADIKVEFNKAYLSGVEKLRAAPVMSTDLRASASLIMAALRAEGETIVNRIYHLDRGYDSIEHKLNVLGADITRIL